MSDQGSAIMGPPEAVINQSGGDQQQNNDQDGTSTLRCEKKQDMMTNDEAISTSEIRSRDIASGRWMIVTVFRNDTVILPAGGW